MADAHANGAYSTVATAPVTPTAGLSLTLAAGDGARFPVGTFNATIWPAAAQPIFVAGSGSVNAEIARATRTAGSDVLALVRAQEGTTARSVVAGDQVIAGVTAQTLTDAETQPASSLRDTYLRPSIMTYETMSRAGQISTAGSLTSGTLLLVGIALPKGAVISNITFVSTGTAAGTPTHWWFGLYDSSRVQLAVTADQLTAAWAGNTAKTLAIATVASGAASSFTTTYEGLHYLGVMVAASSTPTLASAPQTAGIGTLTPVLAGTSSTGQTTPPAFPFTAASMSSSNSQFYAGAA